MAADTYGRWEQGINEIKQEYDIHHLLYNK